MLLLVPYYGGMKENEMDGLLGQREGKYDLSP
jgi:hypothetical protein